MRNASTALMTCWPRVTWGSVTQGWPASRSQRTLPRLSVILRMAMGGTRCPPLASAAYAPVISSSGTSPPPKLRLRP